jgi:hypothetical protein
MAKIDLDSLGIEELASLRENTTDKLFEKVAARRAELEAELEKLAQYGKPIRQACEESGKRTRAQGEEDRRSQRAEGTGRQSSMIRAA